ncbi:38434_t:CDS:2, partial [Gigaspora margarita]
MSRISSKIVIGERDSCKAIVLPKDIISQYIQQSDESLKNLHLYGWVMRKSTEVPRTFQVKFDEVRDKNLVVNICEGNLHYKKQVLSNNEVAETSTTQQNLPEYSENSSEEEDNASNISNVSKVDLTTTVKWCGWPINYPQDMVEKLDSTYGFCVSKVITIDDPQCIIAIASTTAKANEVECVVKNNTSLTTIKLQDLKSFMNTHKLKGPWILII